MVSVRIRINALKYQRAYLYFLNSAEILLDKVSLNILVNLNCNVLQPLRICINGVNVSFILGNQDYPDAIRKLILKYL